MFTLTLISTIISIISGILTVIAFFFAKDNPRWFKKAVLIVFSVAVLFSAGTLIGTAIRNATAIEYLNITDKEWGVSSFISSYLGSDMNFSLNQGEASATLFQVDDEGVATFQIIHETTEKDTDGWLFMVVCEDKRIIQKTYVDERMSMTEVSVWLKPGNYRVWLQLLDYDMSGKEVVIQCA